MADEYLRLRTEVVNTDQVSRLVAEMVKLKDAEYAVAQAADDCKAKEYELGQSFDHVKVAAMEAARAKFEAARAARDAAMATVETVKAASAEGAALNVAGRELQGFNTFLTEMVWHEKMAETATVSLAAKTATVSAAVTTSGKSSQNAGYGFLALAHATQDAQYGFAAILNNIPLIVTGMGGSAGLAGGIMVAGVALNVFGQNLMTSAKSMFDFRTDTEKAAHTVENLKWKIEQIEARPIKVTADYLELDKAKEALSDLEDRLTAYEAAKKKTTSLQEKVGKAVGEVFAENAGATDTRTGTENVAEAVRAAFKAQKIFTPDERLLKQMQEDSEIASMAGQDTTILDMEIAKQVKAAKTAQDAAVNEVVGAAARGEVGGIDIIKSLKEKTPEAFGKMGPLFDFNLEQARPENIKAKEADERDVARQHQLARRNAAMKVVADAEDRKRTEMRLKAERQDEQDAAKALREQVSAMNAFEQDADQAAAAQTQMEHGAETERAKADRAAARGEKAAARAVKGAPRAAAAARRGAIEQGIEGQGFSPDQAAELTPKVQHLMNQNVPFPQALAQIVQQMDRALMMQQAKDEAAMGFMTDATRRFLMMEQHNAQVAQQMRGLAAGNRKGGGGVGRQQIQVVPIR